MIYLFDLYKHRYTLTLSTILSTSLNIIIVNNNQKEDFFLRKM